MSQITRIAPIFVILVVGLSACDELATILSRDDISQTRSDDVLVGIVLPLSGRFIEGPDDPRLVSMLNGYNLARDEINDLQLSPSRFRFILENDRSTEEGAIEAYNKLIHEDEVNAIIGPRSSRQVQAAFPVAQENKIVAIGPTSSAQGLSAIGDYVFRIGLAVDKTIPLGVKLTHETLDYQRVAMLVDRIDLYSRSSNATFVESLDALGVQIVTTETFETNDPDFTGQLTRIKALNSDAIIVSAQPIDKKKIFLQSREVGITSDVPFIIPFVDTSDLQGIGNAADGTITFTNWVSTADTPVNSRFVGRYTATYGAAPNVFAAQAYTSVHLLYTAILRAGSTESAAIRDALAGIKDVETVLGTFSFDAVGDAVYDPKILIVKDGMLILYGDRGMSP